jgi:hypothetical protein
MAFPHFAQYRASRVFPVPQDVQNFTMNQPSRTLTVAWISCGKPVEKQ